MGTLILQLILAVDIAALTWLFLWYGERRVVAAFRDREMRLLMGLVQGVVVIDDQGNVVTMNKEARRLFSGHDADQVTDIQKRLPLFSKDGKSLRGSEHPLRLAFERKSSVSPSKKWIKVGSDFIPVSISAAFVPASKDASSALVGLVRDISKEELMEQMKSDFIGIASHQLRSPMASLKWYGEMLTKDVDKSLHPTQRTYLRRMNEATQRMISLVDDFLDASRFETYGDPMHEDKISVIELLRHIIETQRLFIQAKHLSVRITKEGTIRPIFADPAMLREVLANFVANAVKYNREKGRIAVHVREVGDTLEIRVRDSGVGIPKEQQDQVFTKFFRANNAVSQGVKGTGLGLYTSKLILDQMRGRVRFTSELGEGTTFWITLPRDQREKR